MSDFDAIREDLEKARDEILLKMHLASMDVKTEWEDLEKKWGHFSARAGMDQSAEGVGNALSSLGDELKAAYTRIRNAL